MLGMCYLNTQLIATMINFIFKCGNATIALSRDVYALFLYVSGVDACFPKDVLSIKCKLVEIENTIPVFFTPKVVTVKGNDDGPTNPESTVHNHKATEQEDSYDSNKSSPIIKTDKLRVMERLAHITSACRDLQAQLQNERTVRKNICGILENRITELEIKLTSYSERPKQDREDRPDIDNDVTTDHIDITAPPLENASGNDTFPRASLSSVFSNSQLCLTCQHQLPNHRTQHDTRYLQPTVSRIVKRQEPVT